MAKSNGELTILRKAAIVMAMVGVVIGPYLYHDRAISKIQMDITYIKRQVDDIHNTLYPRGGTNAEKESQDTQVQWAQVQDTLR